MKQEIKLKTLNYMKSFYKENGRCPNLYEIGNFLGLHHDSAKYWTNKLKRENKIKTVIVQGKSNGVYEFQLT